MVKSEAKTELRRLVKAGAQFDLIFADPPYAKQPGDPDLARELLAGEDLRAVLAPGGWLIVESMVTKRADPAMPQWTVVRDRSYGSTRVLLLQSSLSHGPNDAAGLPILLHKGGSLGASAQTLQPISAGASTDVQDTSAFHHLAEHGEHGFPDLVRRGPRHEGRHFDGDAARGTGNDAHA